MLLSFRPKKVNAPESESLIEWASEKQSTESISRLGIQKVSRSRFPEREVHAAADKSRLGCRVEDATIRFNSVRFAI